MLMRMICQQLLDWVFPPSAVAPHRMGGGLDESAELAAAYAEIIAQRKAESRAARRGMLSPSTSFVANSRLVQWLQLSTPRKRPSQRRAAASV